MAKKWLSMILSFAMLLSCVSGITLFTMAEAPASFGYFNFGGSNGRTQNDVGVVRPIMSGNENTADLRGGTAVADTGLYGYKITREGNGIYYGGTFLNAVPDNTGVIYAIEYYIESDEPLVGDAMLVTDGQSGEKTFADLKVGEAGVVYYTLTADQVDAVQANESSGDTRLRVKATVASGGKLYVLGVKVLNAAVACQNVADVAGIHAELLANNVNVTLKNYKEGSPYEDGYTGDVHCAACDTLLKEGEETPATSNLPVPYAWFDTDGGVLSASAVTGASGEAGHTNVMQIPDTDEYGIRLDGDWQGFWFGGKFLNALPEGQSVTMAVEYYITGDVSGRQQLFRYQSYSDMGWKDMFTDTENLVGGKSGLFFHTYTAEEVNAIVNNEWEGDMRFTVLGCTFGANRVYIQSMRLVNTEYVHEMKAGGYSVWDSTEYAVCDYYPDITSTMVKNMGLIVQPPHWNFSFSGNVMAADKTQNKPLYFKITMKDTFTGDSFFINQFERYAGEDVTRWAYDVDAWRESVGKDIRNFPVVDGEVSFILPETSFTNGNNSGSFRIDTTLAEQIARIEVYDLATFCTSEDATAEDIAKIHEMFVSKNINVEKDGRVEATEEQPGYTGDTKCAVCGAVLAAGKEIPVLDPNRPFATLDTADGSLVVNGATLSIKDLGNTDVVAIGDTGEFGIKLTGDWCGFNMDGVSLLGNNGKVAMLIEYYIVGEPEGNAQVFRHQINNRPQVDYFTQSNSLAHDASGLVYHVLSAEEMAEIGDNNFTLRVMGCLAGTDIVYIQSVKIVSADLLNLEDNKGYSYIDFEAKPLTDLYPGILVNPSNGLSYQDLEQHPDHPDRDWLYRYFLVGDELLSTNAVSRPVYIKLYAKEGYENDAIKIHAIERTPKGFGAGAVVQMIDGEGAVFVPSVTFTNGMNNSGSLRVWWEDVAKVARMEIYDAAAYCGRDDADAALVELFHEGMKTDLVNVVRLNKKDPTEEEVGYTGDIYCATCNTLFAMGTEIPKLEHLDLPDPYAYFDTAGGVMKVGGTTLADQGVNPVVSPIGGSGEYGLKLNGDWSGFRMEGITLPTDKELVLAIEYYIDADLTATTQLFRYQTYAAMPGEILPDGTDNHWDDIFNDQDNLVCRESGLLLVPLTAEAVAAINGGEAVKILGCGPGANIVYIQSARIIDKEYTVSSDLGYDYMSFEEVPLCDYYPTIKGAQSSGISVTKTEEGTDPNNNNEPVRFAYIKVTQSLIGENSNYRPVVVRITMKEGFELNEFQLSYQTARKDVGGEWAHLNVPLTDGYAEITLNEACFLNELNGLGSLRLPNHPSCPVYDSLLKLEVIGLTDTSALQALVDGVEEAVVGKTAASAEAYRAVVAQYAALLEDAMVSEAAVEAAVAAIHAAAEAMEDCTHGGATKLVGALEVKNHVVPGYTGDVHCDECNLKLEDGEVIPAHTTEIRNIKEPTCAEAGNSGDRWCVDCDELVEAGDSIMQLPHKWDDGVVTKPATPDTKGEITITCTVCGATKTTRFEFEAGIADVDENGKVDSTDARLVLQFAVKKITPSSLNVEVADVDGNGKVDSTDARLILQYAVKKIDKFPAA